jgi:O6-methylguanine-DNA--protein-cysteine methyltransferase
VRSRSSAACSLGISREEHAAIDTVPVELNGTPFQKQVWQALRRIPHGSTISYAELAKRIGEPAPCGPSAPPTAPIRSRSSFRATASSDPTAR